MDFNTALRDERLVAIIRGNDAKAALRTVMALVEEGIPLIEVSLSGHRRPHRHPTGTRRSSATRPGWARAPS